MNWKVYTVPPILLAGVLSLKSCSGPTPTPAPVPPPVVVPVDPVNPPMPQPPSPQPTPPIVKSDADQVIDITNRERTSRGLVALKGNDKLHQAAQAYAEFMAARDKLSHTLDGNVWDRIEHVGYSYSTCGENIAWNYTTPAQVMEGWMESTGHRANILNPAFREIGVGIATNEKGEKYHCQVFGTPR